MIQYSQATDRKWQKRWQDEHLADFDPERIDKKLYILEMFSYPSGAKLHVGHWYNYALADSYAHMKKMQGYEIFQPMGFDAFGLPAENYAIKTGIHPKDSTEQNISYMRQQLSAMGALFNWEHTLATCDPEYYKWNQWLFLKLYERGLAYRKKAQVNWCPSCQTVLANEQVLADGCCERCGTSVEKKYLTQWFLKITDYADELLDGLKDLDWPEATKKIQEHWIGRSEGSEISFKAEKDGKIVQDADGHDLELHVFTTRADTLLGVTYLTVAPDADLCAYLISDSERAKVEAYQEETKHKTEIDRMSTVAEKTGVFSGSYAIHPLTGERVPIWVGDYVIASYGEGVVMAVPAHDTRDFEFASKFGLPIKEVIQPASGEEASLPFTEDGILFNSGNYDGLASTDARKKITADLAARGLAQEQVNYRLRDWLVSRQRYWGTPIPMIYCDQCGMQAVPYEDLPVLLPYDVEFKPDGDSPLKKCKEFMECKCPKCGGPALRDPDTLDTFVDSSWYQFRYVDNHNDQMPFDREKVNQMCPVDVYVGGAEHAAMHLLYSRFFTKALRDMGLLDLDEPFQRLIHQGLLLGQDGQKMSKSKGNTLSPDPYVEKEGSDILRLYLAFGFAFTEGGPWSDGGIRAIVRFIGRLESLVDEVAAYPSVEDEENLQAQTPAEKSLLHAVHYAIDQVSRDSERFQFNTSIARIMELLNEINSYKSDKAARPELLRYATEKLLLLLAPFAPHFAEEAHEAMGGQSSIFLCAWPEARADLLHLDEVEIAVQINGKIVDRLMLPSQSDREGLLEAVKAHPEFPSWLAGRKIVKEIAVPGRLVNIVVQ